MTLVDLHAHGFPKHVSKPKLAELLEQKYPKYTWEKLYLLKGRYALQSHLCKILQSIFHVRYTALPLSVHPYTI